MGTINAGMLVTREMIEKHPEKVQKIVDTHARTTQYLNDNRQIWLQRAETFGTPRQVLDRAADNMELAWTMDDDFIRRARALGERMQALGVIDRQPDYEKLFDLRFVSNVSLYPAAH